MCVKSNGEKNKREKEKGKYYLNYSCNKFSFVFTLQWHFWLETSTLVMCMRWMDCVINVKCLKKFARKKCCEARMTALSFVC